MHIIDILSICSVVCFLKMWFFFFIFTILNDGALMVCWFSLQYISTDHSVEVRLLLLINFHDFCWPVNTNKAHLEKKTEKLRTVEDKNVPSINGYRAGQRFTLSYVHVPLQHFLLLLFFFLSLVANKTNHHSVSRGGLNVTAPSHKKNCSSDQHERDEELPEKKEATLKPL